MRAAVLIVAAVGTVLCAAPRTLAADAQEAARACRREDGTLTRHLLCLELESRRPPETHARYYDALERLELAGLAELPRSGGKQRPEVLPWLYHAGRGGTVYLPQLTLVDTIDWRERDPAHRLAADCDILSLLNAGVAERYYRGERAGRAVDLVRTSHDHVANLATRAGRPTGVLETVDGTILRGALLVGRDGRPLAPMSEREVQAMYVAHVGLALAREGRDPEALAQLDEALRLAPGEYVAWAGRALALLLRVAEAPDAAAGGSPRWCAGPAAGPWLAEAERAAARARDLAPEADAPHSLLGKIKLYQCEPAEARVHLERAVARSPDPLDLYYLGLILHEQESYRDAIRAVRRGLELVLQRDEPSYATLRYEMEFLLAHAHTARASLQGSTGQLRRALEHLAPVEREFPDDATVLGLRQVIERLERQIGPLRRELGLPHKLGRSLYNATLDE